MSVDTVELLQGGMYGTVENKAGFRLSIPSLDASVNLVHETLSQTQLRRPHCTD